MNNLNTIPHPPSYFFKEMQGRQVQHNNATMFLLADGARLLQYRRPGHFLLDARFGVSLALDDPDHDAHAAGPLLFELNWITLAEPGRAKIFEAMFMNDVYSFLVSPLPIQVLAQHLRRHLDVKLPDGTDMLMRFFDPRVLPFWFPILTGGHHADLGTGVTEWAFFDHQQQLCWLSLDQSNAEASEAKFPFEINAQQEGKLMEQCLPYTLIDRLLPDPTSLLAEITQAQRYEYLAALIKKAQNHGFDGMADLENFCRLGLQYGLDFDQCVPMKRTLAQQNKPGHVHELMALLTVADWKEMKA